MRPFRRFLNIVRVTWKLAMNELKIDFEEGLICIHECLITNLCCVHGEVSLVEKCFIIALDDDLKMASRLRAI